MNNLKSTTRRSADLKSDHVYRVVGRTLQLGRSARDEERFEGLRYVGTSVPCLNGVPDTHNPTEMFYWFAKRQWVLFKPGMFVAEEMID